MRIQSELCHIDEDRTIVRVTAWDRDKPLGSSLGEAKTTEIAEANAIKRLLNNIQKYGEMENHFLLTKDNKKEFRNSENISTTNTKPRIDTNERTIKRSKIKIY